MKTTIVAALTAVSLVAASAAIAQPAPDHHSGGRSAHRHSTHAKPSHAHRHSATAAPCAGGAQGMMGMGGMQRDMSAMMTDMSAMMNSTSDPSMKARMQKMHGQMAGMMANMQKMGGMMGGAMMQGGASERSTPSVAPSPAPEDHSVHHPNQ
jgi:Ni/Co efflux regulator RcnB